MKIWVVSADVHDEDAYGAEIMLFGVYDNEGKANDRADKIRKERNKAANVIPAEVNEDMKYYLGGYIE